MAATSSQQKNPAASATGAGTAALARGREVTLVAIDLDTATAAWIEDRSTIAVDVSLTPRQVGDAVAAVLTALQEGTPPPVIDLSGALIPRQVGPVD